MNRKNFPTSLGGAWCDLLSLRVTLSVLIFTVGSLQAEDPPFPVQPDGARVFTIGNSHTASSLNAGLEELAEANEHPDHHQYEGANIPGSPLWFILENSPNLGPLSAESWDVVTMQSYNSTGQGEIDAGVELARRARQGNPDARVIMFTIWPPYEEAEEPELGRTEEWTETVANAIKAEFPDMPVQVAPTSLVIRELYKRIDAGLVPNLPTSEYLFRDGGHLGRYGAYAVNVTFACMIYNEPPWGYPPIGTYKVGEVEYIEQETADAINAVVWDVLQTYPPALMNSRPVITSLSLDAGVQGLVYSAQINASNVTGSQEFSIAAGTLPAGLTLSPSGEISGTATETGEFPLTIRLTDGADTNERDYTFRVDPDLPPAILTASLSEVQAGQFRRIQLEVADGVGAIIWELTGGELPPGLNLLPYGFLMGAPGKPGTYSFTITATDNHPNGPQSDSQTLEMVIGDPAPETLIIRKYDEAVRSDTDGVFDEPYWNFGRTTQTIEKAVTGNPDGSVVWDAYWMNNALKIGVKITDGERGSTPLDAIEFFMDGNNNDEIIYNYDDIHWKFQRDNAGGNNKIVSGYAVQHAGSYKAIETEDGWQVEISIGGGILQGRGILTAWPEWAVYGFDLAHKQGTNESTDLHRRVWRGTADNPTDTSVFGTIIFDGATTEPNPIRDVVNGDFARDQVYKSYRFSTHRLPEHVWISSFAREKIDGSWVEGTAWNIAEGEGIFQNDSDSKVGGLMQIFDTPPPGASVLRFEYQAQNTGFQVAAWGATVDESESDEHLYPDELTPPDHPCLTERTQFLAPASYSSTGDTQWREVAVAFDITGDAKNFFLVFKSDTQGDTGLGIRNIRLETASGEPEGVDDSALMLRGQSLLLDVLSNDLGFGGILAIDSFTQPGNGFVSQEGSQLRYTPTPTLGDAVDTFTYTPATSAGPAPSPATVTVRVLEEASAYNGDGDALPDAWELTHYGHLDEDGSGDLDQDGQSDSAELASATRDATALDRSGLVFEDDFDDRGPGSLLEHPNLWSFSGKGSARIADLLGIEGSRGLELQADAGESLLVSQYLDTGYEPVIWTDFSAQLAPYAADAAVPEVDNQATVAFYLKETGELMVLDGSTWQIADSGVSLDEAHRFTVRRDFASRQWEMWIDGSMLDDPNPVFAFNSQCQLTTAERFSVQQGSDEPAMIDAIKIWRSAPPGLEGVRYYSNWSSAFSWIGDDALPTVDANANGLPNLLEYAFNLPDPAGTHGSAAFYQPEFSWVQSAELSLTGEAQEPGELQLRFRRNRQAEDLEFLVQKSTDLAEWTTVRVSPGNMKTDDTDDPETEEVTVRVPAQGSETYLRLNLRKR